MISASRLDRYSVRISATIKRQVSRNARHRCEYCQSQELYAPTVFSVEHIIPIKLGGGHDVNNLALSCQQCNNHKYIAIAGVDPLSGDTVSLFHPRTASWCDHFAWNDDYSLIVALSPTGRATIEKLQLNRTNLVSLRRVLFMAGLHPPDDNDSGKP